MTGSFYEIIAIGLIGGPILYLLLKAIARRMVSPKPAVFLAAIAAGCLAPFAGDFVAVPLGAIAAALVDLLVSTKPVAE